MGNEGSSNTKAKCGDKKVFNYKTYYPLWKAYITDKNDKKATSALAAYCGTRPGALCFDDCLEGMKKATKAYAKEVQGGTYQQLARREYSNYATDQSSFSIPGYGYDYGHDYGHNGINSDYMLILPLAILVFLICCIFCAVCIGFSGCVGYLFGQSQNIINKNKNNIEVPSYQEVN